MSTMPGPFREDRHPFGLPMGTVRGFMALLICSFFWIVFLLPENKAVHIPLAHYGLLFLVALALAAHPFPRLGLSNMWADLMWLLYVGGSVLVLVYVSNNYPDHLKRLTPDPADFGQWPTLAATLAGAFFFGVLVHRVLGNNSALFETIRAWIGVVAIILLLIETVFQFMVIPGLNDKPSQDTLKVWESIVIGFTAAYFGTRVTR